MTGEKLGKIDEEKLPLIYRLILRLPKPTLDFLPEVSQGIFWAIIVPIFLILEFFLSVFLLVAFPFPTNILFTSIVPTIIFIIFLRTMLERSINSWNALMESGIVLNVEKAVRDYVDFLKKQKSKKNQER